VGGAKGKRARCGTGAFETAAHRKEKHHPGASGGSEEEPAIKELIGGAPTYGVVSSADLPGKGTACASYGGGRGAPGKRMLHSEKLGKSWARTRRRELIPEVRPIWRQKNWTFGGRAGRDAYVEDGWQASAES